ncbi:hypothetical protein LSH36_498g00061 [Paralvinella palmiformis]|uniref:G-protein coupled receptors family 1 profile domain-containing protein n=1 Tax=Paralvinella palmiformis TaxID=53620 RepID=A0AAD9J900_9ANNE|nr:hypothetical protein LSH36_498g00061 [Paralvinella palmiformis]
MTESSLIDDIRNESNPLTTYVGQWRRSELTYISADLDRMNITGTMHVRSYEEPLMEFPAYRLHKRLITYLPPILILLGTIGNVLSVIILSRRSLRKQSTYFYLATLSSADTVVLYVGLLRIWLGEILGQDIRDRSDWSCRIISFLGYTISDFSGWLIIAVTLERFFAVRYPFRVSGSRGRQRALKVVGAMLLLMSLVNCHFFWSVRVVYMKHGDEYTAKCHCTEPYLKLIDDVWPWVDALIYSFLPFVVILVLNTLIIRQLVRARRRRVALSSAVTCRKCHAADGCRVSDRDGGKITVMLLVISLAFLVTTLPMNVALITSKFLVKRRPDIGTLIRLRLVLTVTELLMYLNHSINFLLYCAAGHRFRAECVRLMLGRKSTPAHHVTDISGAISHALHMQVIKPSDAINTP